MVWGVGLLSEPGLLAVSGKKNPKRDSLWRQTQVYLSHIAENDPVTEWKSKPKSQFWDIVSNIN